MHGPAASTSVGKRGLPVLHQASRRTGHAAIAGEQPSASKNRGLVRRRRRSLTGRSANTVVVRPGWPDRRMKRSENDSVISSAGEPPASQMSQPRARKTRSSCGRSRSASAVRRGSRVRPTRKGGSGRGGRHRVSAPRFRASRRMFAKWPIAGSATRISRRRAPSTRCRVFRFRSGRPWSALAARLRTISTNRRRDGACVSDSWPCSSGQAAWIPGQMADL